MKEKQPIKYSKPIPAISYLLDFIFAKEYHQHQVNDITLYSDIYTHHC